MNIPIARVARYQSVRYMLFVMTAVGLLLTLAAGFTPDPSQLKPDAAAGREAAPAAPVHQLSAAGFEQQAKKLEVTMEGGGAELSFIVVEKALVMNPSFARSCHPLLHRLGQAAYKYYGGFAPAMAAAQEVCNSGYVHGVIEANFASQPDVASALSSSCPDTASQTYANWQCFHGAGHGIMYRQANNVQASLDDCQILEGNFARQACSNGVYMEAFNLVDHGGSHSHTKPDPGLALCAAQTRFRSDCYYYAPYAYLEQQPDQYLQAVTWCTDAKLSDTYTASCVRGVGGQLMRDNIAQPGFAARVCQQLADKQRRLCVSGAAGLAVNHYADSKTAETICRNFFQASLQDCLDEVAQKRDQFSI